MEDIGVVRNVDIVFVIDGTGSMTPIMDTVKKHVLAIYPAYEEQCRERHVGLNEVRAKLIVFRDYLFDGDAAMQIGEWIDIKNNPELFKKKVEEIQPVGGGDLPENGFEALYYATRSDFKATGPRDRQIIMLMTDANALSMDDRKDCPDYPKDVGTLLDIFDAWMGDTKPEDYRMTRSGKRLFIFAPEDSLYKGLTETMDKVSFEPIEAAMGLSEVDFASFISALVFCSL